jgi:UDP-N-acetylmuramoylalanine--D-glutamate ligase
MDFNEHLDIAVITNISENHLDWHTDMEEYILAKKRILKNAGLSVLNYDSDLVRGLGNDKTVYFSMNNCEDLLCQGKKFVHIVNGIIYFNETPLFSVSDICLRGEFNVQNVLCAIACTYGIVDKSACHTVAREFCGVDNRMENLGTHLGRTFICSAIDSTHTRSINTLNAFPLDKVVAIMGGYDKNLSYECLAPTLNKVKATVICGENREKIMAVAGSRAINVSTLKEALVVAFKLSSQGDYIILSPASCSFDMFKNYKEKAKCFKEAVKEIRNGEY